ncbi:MAG: DUF2461 family protein, partial [Clostridia bacterium]|nr:DUF2461 family protein [Clostridia bacterium]
IKRMAIPAEVPEELREWYALRGFYFEREIDDFDLLRSPALVDEIAAGYREIRPLYQYILALAPEEDGIDVGKR